MSSNLAPIQELLDKVIDADHLAQYLENMSFKYTQYLLTDKDRCGSQQQEAEELYWVNELKETMKRIKEQQ
jgi:hypothetical protein